MLFRSYSPSFFLVKRNCDSLASFLKTDCPFLTPKALILPCAGKGVRRIFAIRFATCLIQLNFEARAVILCFFQYAFFCQNCQSAERKIQNFVRTCKTFRACLKKKIPQSEACRLRKCFFRHAPESNPILPSTFSESHR